MWFKELHHVMCALPSEWGRAFMISQLSLDGERQKMACVHVATSHPPFVSPTLSLPLLLIILSVSVSLSLSLSPLLTEILASPVMVLDERGGWYLIGSPCPQQLLHTISLTLSHPHNLHMVSSHHHPSFIFPPL